MTLNHIYAIKDTKGGDYHTPFFQPTDVHAIRWFKTEINRADPSNLLFLYPEDFELHQLGSFENENGKIKPDNKMIATGSSVKNKD